MMLSDQAVRKHGSDMAEILPFAISASKRPPRHREGTGEVVIFPGIRVEYHDGAPPPPTKGRSRRGKRGAAKGAALSA
jgi:hypothetical protein